MKLDFTTLTYDPQPYEYEGATLYIRMFPSSMATWSIKDGALVLDGEQRWEMFNYCLTDWATVTDANDAPLPCTDDTKKMVFDFNMAGIPLFVINTAIEHEAEKEDQEKNS